jgi:hypothetical protein
MVQYPSVKTICPTLISKEGAGKGSLVILMKKMLGLSKVFETTKPGRDVWGNFNSIMSSCFFVVLNELSKKDTTDFEGVIKGLITDGTLPVNGKGDKLIVINSYHRFLITTNKAEPITTSADDRRNLIIRSSDELCKKTAKNKIYYDKLYSYLEDKNVIATCFNYFKSIQNLDKFNNIPIPKTEYQENLKQLELSPPEQFIKELVTNEKNEKVELKSKDIFTKFTLWCNENNVDYNITPLKLMVRIANLNINGIEKKHTKDGNASVFNVKEIKEHFQIDSDEFIDEIIIEKPIEAIVKAIKTKRSVNTCHLDISDD